MPPSKRTPAEIVAAARTYLDTFTQTDPALVDGVLSDLLALYEAAAGLRYATPSVAERALDEARAALADAPTHGAPR